MMTERLMEALDDTDVAIIRASAECSMRVNQIAKMLHYDRRTISNRLTTIRLRTGIDPRDFWGLHRLILLLEDHK